MTLKEMLDKMFEAKASDLHIRANSFPYLRINGELVKIGAEMLSDQETQDIAYEIMNNEQRQHFLERHEVDLGITYQGTIRLRANIFCQRGVINIALRYIPTEIATSEQLNLPPVIYKLTEHDRGLVLVTGQTGSGKSTTLAAMIDHINSTYSAHIVTVEDPIEFLHKDKKSIISQRELGIDTLSYLEALRHVVRQDPDVILMGEARDYETMSAAITSAQMGHLVFSTIHTVDTVQTISRVVNLFPQHIREQIRTLFAETLVGIISQRLLPKTDGSGMIPAVEVLIATPLIKKSLIEGNLAEVANQMKQGEYYGMQTFNQSLLKLYQAGKIKLEDALEAATSPEELMLAIRGVQSSTESAQTIERFGGKK